MRAERKAVDLKSGLLFGKLRLETPPGSSGLVNKVGQLNPEKNLPHYLPHYSPSSSTLAAEGGPR